MTEWELAQKIYDSLPMPKLGTTETGGIACHIETFPTKTLVAISSVLKTELKQDRTEQWQLALLAVSAYLEELPEYEMEEIEEIANDPERLKKLMEDSDETV